MKILNCEAVIFDLDGTLYDKKRIALYSMLKQLKTMHVLNHSNKIRKEMKGRDFKSRENYFENFYKRVSEKSSLTVEELENWYNQSFYRGFIEILRKKYKAQDNLIPLLEAAKGEIPMAVFSDYSHVDERLEALEIDGSFFEITAGSEDYGVLKPSARPLLDIADKLGVPPEKVLMVGDRQDTDGKAAEMAGMMFYFIDGKSGWKQFTEEMVNYLKERGSNG